MILVDDYQDSDQRLKDEAKEAEAREQRIQLYQSRVEEGRAIFTGEYLNQKDRELSNDNGNEHECED